MLDKVDIRIPELAALGPVLTEHVGQLKNDSAPLFRPSRFYQQVSDLRERVGIDAVVHLSFRYGCPTHKVEIIDAGEKTLSDMAEIVTKLFDVDPWSLSLMRLDLAADIEGVPVPWFKHHAVVNRKRFSSQIEKSTEQELKFVGMGTAEAQSLYVGKRPNLVRIYDKIAEWRMQLSKLERDAKRFNARLKEMALTPDERYYGARTPPNFEDYCKARGYAYREDKILTRIERQIGSNQIPSELRTIADLKHAHEFKPFKDLRILPTGPLKQIGCPPRGVPVRNWLAYIGFCSLEKFYGSTQLARSVVLQHGQGNGKRILESIEEAAPQLTPPVTMEQIQESYRRSTLIQNSGKYLCPTYEYAKQST